jgi:hypothetical protein
VLPLSISIECAIATRMEREEREGTQAGERQFTRQKSNIHLQPIARGKRNPSARRSPQICAHQRDEVPGLEAASAIPTTPKRTVQYSPRRAPRPRTATSRGRDWRDPEAKTIAEDDVRRECGHHPRGLAPRDSEVRMRDATDKGPQGGAERGRESRMRAGWMRRGPRRGPQR